MISKLAWLNAKSDLENGRVNKALSCEKQSVVNTAPSFSKISNKMQLISTTFFK
jgi:hypothetical protein